MAIPAGKRDFLNRFAIEIRDSLISKPSRFGRTIFLCGAAPGTRDSKRDRIARGLSRHPVRYWYSDYEIYFPETLFDGLMSGPGSFDLLTLENTLAEGVDAVVMVLESEGTTAELGAFANHRKLRHKLVLIQDKKYATAKTFIGRGPVRFIKDNSDGQVVFADFDRIDEYLDKIRESIGKVADANPVEFNFGNILHAHNFVIPCLFLLEQLNREEIEILIQAVTQVEENRARIIASAAILILVRRRYIARERENFHLTDRGIREFLKKGHWLQRTAKYSRSAIDRLRVDVITAQRRRQRPWL